MNIQRQRCIMHENILTAKLINLMADNKHSSETFINGEEERTVQM
jgi:hypothetical protein